MSPPVSAPRRRRRHPLLAIFRWFSRRREMNPLTLLLVAGMYGAIAVYPLYHHVGRTIIWLAIIFGALYVANTLTEEPFSDNEARQMSDSLKVDGARPRRQLASRIE